MVHLKVLNEHMTYGDMLLLDYLEDYHNVSRKIYGMLRYAELMCKKAKCILKSDDDMIINYPELEKVCDSLPGIATLLRSYFEGEIPWDIWG